MGDVDATLKATRDVLKGTFKKTPKTIGDWGYEVDDTPKAKPTPAEGS